MLDRIWKNRSIVGSSLLAALLFVPAIGCGPGDTDDDDDIQTTPTPSTEATPTPTPVVGDAQPFPNGNFYYQSIYTFTFRTVPYVLTIAGYANGTSNTGDFTGDYIWIFWNDQESADADNGADCLMYEALTCTDISAGNTEGLDYGSCIFCDPFSDFVSVYDHDDGCSEEIFDWWYLNDETGEYDYEYYQEIGYRPATDGWPSEFSEIADALTDNGWVGTIYDLLLSEEGEFVPTYIVAPVAEEEAAKERIQNIKKLNPELIIEVTLDGPSDVKAFLNSHKN